MNPFSIFDPVVATKIEEPLVEDMSCLTLAGPIDDGDAGRLATGMCSRRLR